MADVLPTSEPASKVSAIQRRRSSPWRMTTADPLGTVVVVVVDEVVGARVVVGTDVVAMVGTDVGAVVGTEVVDVVPVDDDGDGASPCFDAPQPALTNAATSSAATTGRGDRVNVPRAQLLAVRWRAV